LVVFGARYFERGYVVLERRACLDMDRF